MTAADLGGFGGERALPHFALGHRGDHGHRQGAVREEGGHAQSHGFHHQDHDGHPGARIGRGPRYDGEGLGPGGEHLGGQQMGQRRATSAHRQAVAVRAAASQHERSRRRPGGERRGQCERVRREDERQGSGTGHEGHALRDPQRSGRRGPLLDRRRHGHLGRYAMQNEQFRTFVDTKEYTLKINGEPSLLLNNTNTAAHRIQLGERGQDGQHSQRGLLPRLLGSQGRPGSHRRGLGQQGQRCAVRRQRSRCCSSA